MRAQVMERMRSTLFCLVLPGDSASARRTSEIFMAGCIPVFLGPPYGSMPLADGGIDYRASSLFFNVTDYRWRLSSLSKPSQQVLDQTESGPLFRVMHGSRLSPGTQQGYLGTRLPIWRRLPWILSENCSSLSLWSSP